MAAQPQPIPIPQPQPQPQPQPIPQPYETQYQPQTTATVEATANPTPQPYDPSSTSQIQSYDPYSTYYTSYQQQQQQQQQLYSNINPDYSSSTTYYPNYSTSYDPNSIYPPGVAISDSQHAHNYYYQSQPYFQPGQPVYGGGSQGGQSMRGRGRGRGRGGGRGKPVTPAPPKEPPQMAWCELCRVDCNTREILEKHKNGKKHQRNLKVFEELQTTTKPITVVNQQLSVTQPQPEGSDTNPFPAEYVAAPAQELNMADNTMAQPSGGRGGLKRKMNGGRGGKWVRNYDGTKRFVAAPKANQMIPILCELCNVKCESQIVYASHVAGKKHLSTLKRYQDHKETFGEGVEALYPTPTIPNLPSIPVMPQTHQQVPIANPVYQDAPLYPQTHQQVPVPQDAQALASMMLSQQNLPNPEAAQAALAELLNQHGIHDAQTLIVQLVPYLLTQPQVPGAELLLGSVPLSGSELNASYQGEGPNISTEAGGKNGDVKTEQQNLAGFDGSGADAGTNNKADDGPLEPGNAGEVSNKPDNELE